MKIKKQTVHQFLQKTIERLVKPPVNWGREMKLMKSLWEKYPNKILWSSIDIKLNSLAFFVLKEGNEYILNILKQIEFVPIKNVVPSLSSERQGEDRQIKKVLTIKDFLNK